MASEKCLKPCEQTNPCAQPTNYYQKTTATYACHDKPKPIHHEHSLTGIVKELAHSATKIFHHDDHHGHAAHNGYYAQGQGHAAHNGYCAQGQGQGHGHGHSAHSHGHGHSAHSHGHGHSAHSHEHGHSAHSHEHGHSAHGYGYKHTANYSTGAAHGGLNGYTTNNGGQSLQKSHEHKKLMKQRENKLSGCSSENGSSSECEFECECEFETLKKTY
ncbi:histidine-rich glycoprotein-like [Sesamum indicum]|uniref:Histidine-rich glycoprotein-like n=1 Tax=Sesamum indicum TaxID=4182 RepID=A0A6I9UHC4_SESIN|nr:histidine-rich glycoprotein-like [Sesamum indicum]